jgi:hypothetical protein
VLTGTTELDAAIAVIEESIVLIVREATLPRVQERFVSHSGVALERAAYGVLREVSEQGSVRLTELANLIGLDLSTVSRQVKGLESLSLLTRKDDPIDRRAMYVTLTERRVGPTAQRAILIRRGGRRPWDLRRCGTVGDEGEGEPVRSPDTNGLRLPRSDRPARGWAFAARLVTSSVRSRHEQRWSGVLLRSAGVGRLGPVAFPGLGCEFGVQDWWRGPAA